MAKNKRKNYYAVAGVNGYGTRELAVQMYRELIGPYTVGKVLEPIVSTNWFYRTDF